MRGELIFVWNDMQREVWEPLCDREDMPEDAFCELYRELAVALREPLSIEALADIVDSPTQSREAFETTKADSFSGERALVAFAEAAHQTLEDLGGDSLSNAYFGLLERFIEKFSLRYDLRRPCFFCPTLPGVFASLVLDLRSIARNDAHINALMREFDEAVRDLRTDCSDGRIKTCIQKQINLLEAVCGAYPGVTKGELGNMCNQIGTWPHAAIKASLRNLYGFASDYPGIRHGGSPSSAVRAVEMRDMIAVSILLMGFTPYLSDVFDADVVYRGV